MADPRTSNLNLYKIGAASDNVGVHMITHYNFNIGQLDAWIGAHDVSSITIASGTLTITATDGTTYTASVDAEDMNYSNGTSGLSATQVQAAIDEIVTAMASKADASTVYTKTETNGLIEALDYSDTAVSGSYVTEVDETDGVISVTREAADASPTDSSTKMVTSGGVKTALDNKMSYADNGVLGAKNLIPLSLDTIKSKNTNGTWSDNVYSYNGVDFTVNTDSDGNVTSIGVSGTASALTNLDIITGSTAFSNGTYILNGCPAGGGNDTYEIDFYSLTAADKGDGYTFAVSSGTIPALRIRIASGYTASSLILYPMIRLASDTDSTFQPYAKTNLQLTNEVDAINTDLASTYYDLTGLIPNVNGDMNYCMRSGNVVTVTVGTGNLPNASSCVQLPEGYRPKSKRYLRCGGECSPDGAATTFEPCAVTIYTDGNVTYGNISGGVYSIIRLSFTFII